MANLIPPNARKKVKLEYWARVVSVWLVMLGLACLVVTALHVPVYKLVGDQNEVFNAWHEEVDADNKQFKESVKVINNTNEISRLLSSDAEQILFTEVIDEVDSLINEDVVVESYRMERSGGKVTNFVVSGESTTRFGLADFRKALENSDMFETAALPLSNLAKDADIPFDISVSLTNKQTES